MGKWSDVDEEVRSRYRFSTDGLLLDEVRLGTGRLDEELVLDRSRA